MSHQTDGIVTAAALELECSMDLPHSLTESLYSMVHAHTYVEAFMHAPGAHCCLCKVHIMR